MPVTKAFKDKWLEKLTNGSKKRNRGGLKSDDGGETCVMAVAREVAQEMDMIPKGEPANNNYLEDEELNRIGLNRDTQLYLAHLNDIYIAKEGMFPTRAIRAIEALPIRVPIDVEKREPLLIEKK